MNHWTAEDVPDQSGRIAVVTGANSGLGLRAARVLAGRGASVVLASRDAAKAEAAAREIGGDVTCVRLDLASFASVREASQRLHDSRDRIDLLINNAGVMMTPQARTEDGFELQVGTNHLGHFALTGLLLDLVVKVPGSRVVTVSSMAHMWGRLPSETRRYSPTLAYGDSKLANLLFAFELQHRLAAANAQTISLAAHPGYARTGLTRYLRAPVRIGSELVEPFLAQSAEMGVLPVLRAATDPAAEPGAFYGPGGLLGMKGYPVRARPLAKARDRSAQRRLWARSEQQTGVSYPV
jgi:NAD(P)-dependent dehydrogenase (short-subunit alcohol dehydrogenase family)